VARASQHRASRALSAGPRARARIRVASMGRTGLVRARAPAIQWGLLDCKGVVEGNRVPCEAVAERDEVLDAREVYIRFGDGRHVCLVELVDAMRRNG